LTSRNDAAARGVLLEGDVASDRGVQLLDGERRRVGHLEDRLLAARQEADRARLRSRLGNVLVARRPVIDGFNRRLDLVRRQSETDFRTILILQDRELGPEEPDQLDAVFEIEGVGHDLRWLLRGQRIDRRRWRFLLALNARRRDARRDRWPAIGADRLSRLGGLPFKGA
jgi:hypothetical protein